jgi:hypothetical protein
MENLCIVMGLRHVSQGLVQVPTVVRDQCIDGRGRAGPPEGGGMGQSRVNVGASVICSNTSGAEPAHQLLLSTFPVGVVCSKLGPIHAFEGGIVDVLELPSRNRMGPPARRLSYLFCSDVTQDAYALVAKFTPDRDRVAQWLRVDVTIPGVSAVNAWGSSALFTRMDAACLDPGSLGQRFGGWWFTLHN